MGRTLSSDSASVIALPASPTGFTVGDYVYQTTSGYGAVPNAALATGNFNLGAVASPDYEVTATTSNELTYVEQLGGSQGSQVAAQLTNGNIVYAYATGSASTYANPATVNFRIETTAGTSVVAQTSTTMTTQGPFNVGVVALPAGGFCIVASSPTGSNSSFGLSARFYNADGTAATAVLNSGLTISTSAVTNRLKLQALSDGSVILGYFVPNNAAFRKVTTAGFDATFNSSGVYNAAVGTTVRQNWDFIVDGSNNIHIIFTSATANAQIARLNSVGQQQSSSAVTTLTGVAAVAIVLGSNGTIRGIVQDSTGITTLTWDGTTAAVGTRIITSSTPPGGGALGAFAQGASGGYVVFYNAYIGGTSAIGLFFQAFSSADAALATATRVNSAIAINYRNQLTPIVVSGNTRVYFGVFQANAISYAMASSAVPMGIAYFTYSNTTYALVGAPTVGFNYGDQGPFALGEYMRGVSTAATARFTVATTGTYPINVPLGTALIPKTLVDGNQTVIKLALAPLPNGEFVAVWVRNDTYVTLISKYSATGVLQVGPVTVSAVGTGNAPLTASVATFANGNILVTYSDATATTVRFRIYTPSLTVVTSGDIDTAAMLNQTPTPVTCASFGDGDHIAVLFRDSSNYMQVRCVQSTGTVTARLGVGLTSQTAWYQPQIIGFKSNAFTIAAVDASTTVVRGFSVRKTGPTSFLGSAEFTIGASFSSIGNTTCVGSPIATPGTAGFYISGNTDGAAYRIISVNPLFSESNQLSIANTSGTLSGYTIGTASSGTIGYTATGLPVIVASRGATANVTLSAFTNPMDTGSANTAGVTTALATSGSQVAVTAIPHIGDAILIGFIDDSNRAAFTSIVASPFTVSGTLTAGTDISTSTLSLLPQAGYSLQGISLTAAASGSMGLVQTRGTAALNSNYSASTPATNFDSRNPTTFGISGTIIGRTVIMGNN